MIIGRNKILTTKGYRFIDSLPESIAIMCIESDSTYPELVPAQAKIFKHSSKNTYLVNQSNFPPIIATDDTEILVKDPFDDFIWKSIKSISSGDKIYIPDHLSLYPKKINPIDYEYQMAGEYSSMFGENTYTTGGFSKYRIFSEDVKKYYKEHRKDIDLLLDFKSEVEICSFLRGLFSRDGVVKIDAEKYVLLISNDVHFLYEIQLLLKQFQIYAKVVKDDEKKHLPKLKIHHLRYLNRFFRYIGFKQPEKMQKLQYCLSCFKRDWFGKHYYGTVIDIQESGKQDVYEISCEHAIINGAMVKTERM